MIEANKGGILQWWWDRYVDRKVRRAFRGLWVSGALPASDEPLLLYANHTSWWDGFIAHQLCRAAGRDVYCMMEEQNLRRYPFLARLGAFSIRRGDARSAFETLRYARTLLQRPRATVVVFPEGVLGAFSEKPRTLERGVEVLARLGGVRALPAAFRLTLFEHELPDVLVEMGEPHAQASLGGFASRLHEVTARAARANGTEGYQRLVAGSTGVAEKWSRFSGWREAS